MNKQSNIDIKKFIDTFENLARIERHNQTIMGIKKSEARVLLCVEFLHEEKKCKVNISEISKNLSITSPSTTEFVKNLINKGYLEKHVSQNDKRFIEITLTDDGKKIVQDLKKYFNSLFSGVIEILGEEKSKLLIELLDIVNIYFTEWYSRPK
ncbi:MarR family winged helix-turn-helix transcriptional regulator [Paraclostridium bifermentans]|uniref:MarR family winged helix-turn-helix transcriptional regulator n=1 Tax=Paraclostridium TaxID=1849822 RepID=UPI001CC6B5B0|nr:MULTISPECIES: MarR family winged helix-turn-helix transcriptional regulator [Paraclostridium]MBZ6006832.1 MarR family winged helix-turn-helix transcriptional regulator [Paraclostridium bifermentans]MDU0295949.1 MarR family winged helix-turn-helix transcriptional regulator [Paraclostridium sp. MRS3W1]